MFERRRTLAWLVEAADEIRRLGNPTESEALEILDQLDLRITAGLWPGEER